MLKIAICDDEMYMVDKIEMFILKYENDNNLDFQIDKYYNGMDLLNSDKGYDLVFLDIQMEKMDGIMTGKLIKDHNMSTPIVYITSFADESQRAHKVHAFDFVVKPFEYSEIEEVMRDFCKLSNKTKESFIQLRTESGDELIQNTDKIIYFEYDKQRTIIMKTVDSEIMIKGILYEILEKLDRVQFAQPHKAYILNLMYVQSIEKGNNNVILKNKKKIPLSQKKRIEFREKLHKFMRV
ncbi:MAG: response regulator transcription factor [Oscillospiraceae bacterium]|nr:response regulator transcription factor [Oscillospiraceae bacterium]